MIMKSIVLFAHDDSANHGCEAIVRSTNSIIKSVYSEIVVNLVSDSPQIDREYMGDSFNYFSVNNDGKRNIRDFIPAYFRYKLLNDKIALDVYPYNEVIRALRKPLLALSIGGDNYCYGYTAYYGRLNKMFRKAGHKTVLWGCSINEDALKEKGTLEDLKSYSLITARESLTFNLLKSHYLDNVELYPDPAFVLDADISAIPAGFNEYNTIGINISPMIQDNEHTKGAAFQNYRNLIRWIIDETDYDIALIPHVVWKPSDDRIPLANLYNEFCDSGRVKMIEDDNAERLKGIISKCRFMVAARTHASIAAYSTCVPTLVVGYSVKAKGIAKDIFGSYEDYVLPVQDLKSPNDLSNKFKWLMDHEKEIRNHLSSFMPGYIARAWQAGEALKKI